MCTERQKAKSAAGFTLLETLVAIVIIAVALTGFTVVVSGSALRSADPVLRAQAAAIAHAYLEEIMSKAYADPDGTEAGEVRTTFDDVDDYNGLSNAGARDINDAAIAGLGNYNVDVSVSAQAVNGVAMQRIEVAVSHANAPIDVTIAAYRGPSL